MLRLDADPAGALEGVDALRVHVAGAESNVAATLARLGLRAAWISKLPVGPLGQKVERTLRAHGVDTSRVVWEETGRLGVFFTHLPAAPRRAIVIYDRQDSSFTRLDPAEVDWAFVTGSRLLHLTGITPALGERPRRLIERALDDAAATGLSVSFDVNYRSRLWPPERARVTLTPLIQRCQVVICSQRDARTVFQVTGTPEGTARALQETFGVGQVCLTLGADGAGVLDGERWEQMAALSSTVVDPIGRGDAFTAGILYARMTTGDPALGLRYGLQLAALKQACQGDIAWVDAAALTVEGGEGVPR